ncbi:hypothetical protein BKA70DRAFT_1570693 [Coprinopsis sp. MPI-PUGE-AT-0042]|nr:hypothetical protein BKA70DRAFT_1570693 [Coprinopsis sp. MPI-PUGE-AT-0042]
MASTTMRTKVFASKSRCGGGRNSSWRPPSLTKETHVESPATQQPSASPIGNGSHPCSSYEAAVVTRLRSKRMASLWGPSVPGSGLTFDSERRRRAHELDQHKRKSLASPAGNLGGQGVAILPDEKYLPVRKNPSQRVKQSDGCMSDHPSKCIEDSIALTLGEPLHPAGPVRQHLHVPPRMDQIPLLMEHLSGSVGSLPGPCDETDVPILPDEREVPEKPYRRFSIASLHTRLTPDQQQPDIKSEANVLKQEGRSRRKLGKTNPALKREAGAPSSHPLPQNYECHSCAAWDAEARSSEEKRCMRAQSARKLAELDRPSQPERVELKKNDGELRG